MFVRWIRRNKIIEIPEFYQAYPVVFYTEEIYHKIVANLSLMILDYYEVYSISSISIQHSAY